MEDVFLLHGTYRSPLFFCTLCFDLTVTAPLNHFYCLWKINRYAGESAPTGLRSETCRAAFSWELKAPRITRRNTHPLNCVTQMSSSLPLWLNRQKGENKINTTCLAKSRSRTQRSTLGNFLHCGEITHLRRSVFALARPVVSLLAWSRRAAGGQQPRQAWVRAILSDRQALITPQWAARRTCDPRAPFASWDADVVKIAPASSDNSTSSHLNNQFDPHYK